MALVNRIALQGLSLAILLAAVAFTWQLYPTAQLFDRLDQDAGKSFEAGLLNELKIISKEMLWLATIWTMDKGAGKIGLSRHQRLWKSLTKKSASWPFSTTPNASLETTDPASACPCRGCCIKTGDGLVIGMLDRSKRVRQFLGIPYAAPPVGRLRFLPPTPIPPYDRFYASSYGHHCHVVNNEKLSVVKDFLLSRLSKGAGEDCLSLNIFAPIIAESTNAPLPVIVFVHGGKFSSGSASQRIYDGLPFIRENQNVILITLNYRLGPLGFFYSSQLAAASPSTSVGNSGLLDIHAALKWIKNNVAEFGGDPAQITAVGQSAGAVALNYLVAMPEVFERTFTKLAMLSATKESWPLRRPGGPHTQLSFDLLAEKLDCTAPMEDVEIVECLRRVPARTLMETATRLGMHDLWGPILDGLLIKHPLPTSFPNDMSILLSAVEDEASVFFKKVRLRTKEDTIDAARRIFGAELTRRIVELYDIPNSNHDPMALASKIAADAIFHCRIESLAHALVSQNHPAVYLTRFKTQMTGSKLFHLADQRLKGGLGKFGVFHGIDLFFLFNVHPWLFTKEEAQVASELRKRIVAFARTGSPNAASVPVWPRLVSLKTDGQRGDVLEEGMAGFDLRPVCQFWREVPPFETLPPLLNHIDRKKTEPSIL